MEYRELADTGIQASRIALGAGPVSGLMVGDSLDEQSAVVRRALEVGVNWFDTAPTYGDGRSEQALGRALRATGADPSAVHVATKVRLVPEKSQTLRDAIRRSLAGSLERLGSDRITLLQLHNSVTCRRGDLPTSLTPEDVLGPRGILDTFEELRSQGLVDHFGFTGLGDQESLTRLVDDGRFSTVQVPYNILTPLSGVDRTGGSIDVEYDEFLAHCRHRGLATLAIRVFAGGALSAQAPSAHTRKTKFFPLDLFHRDRVRASRLTALLPAGVSPAEASCRFVLEHSDTTLALLGFATPVEVDEAVAFATRGALDPTTLASLAAHAGTDLRTLPPSP